MSVRRILLASAALMLCAADYPTFDPRNPQPVIDAADVIAADVEASLNQRLTAFDSQYHATLVVVTTPSLRGEPLESYSLNVARQLGVGHAGSDQGVVLLMAPTEHRVRIETGYGARTRLTDAAASDVVRNVIVADMKSGRTPSEAIVDGVDAILPLMKPETAQERLIRQREEAVAARRRRELAADVGQFLFFGGIGGLLASPFIWMGVRRRRRRREAEEAREREEEEQYRTEQAERDRKLEERRRRYAEQVRREREEMLAAMTPAKRRSFLAREEAERVAAAEEERKTEEERRRRRRRNSSSSSYGGYGSSSYGAGSSSSGSYGSSSSGSSFGGFSGGGFGGGGSSGSW